MFSSMVNASFDECALYKTFNIKPAYCAGIKPETKEVMKQRDKA